MSMIDFEKNSPKTYWQHSRDYQYLGKLFDVLLNSAKTNAELLNTLPFTDDTPEKMLDYLALTLGFKAKHNYNTRQLRAICSVFSEIIKNKGTENAISIIANALLASEGIDDEATIINDKENYVIRVLIPQSLSDLNLFNDLLDYVLPAGMCCEVIRTSTFETADTTTVGTLTSLSVTYITPTEYNGITTTDDVIENTETAYVNITDYSSYYIITQTITTETGTSTIKIWRSNQKLYKYDDKNKKYVSVAGNEVDSSNKIYELQSKTFFKCNSTIDSEHGEYITPKVAVDSTVTPAILGEDVYVLEDDGTYTLRASGTTYDENETYYRQADTSGTSGLNGGVVSDNSLVNMTILTEDLSAKDTKLE